MEKSVEGEHMGQKLSDFPDTILWHDFGGIYDDFTHQPSI